MTAASDPVLGFGAHRGSRVSELPEGYVLWLADPAREVPSPPRPGRAGGGHRPLPADVVAAARIRMAEILAAREVAARAALLLGGHGHDGPDPVYVIDCDGDMHSRSGDFVLQSTIHATLDDALAAIAGEYPVVAEDAEDAAHRGRPPRGPMVRSTPDPEDDAIVVWEVLPSGHRRAAWAFLGWHHAHRADSYACGQGALPGDGDALYAIAARDC